MSKFLPSRIYDFTNLKKPPPDDTYANIHPLRKISATKLFTHQNKEALQNVSDTDIYLQSKNTNIDPGKDNENKIQKRIFSQPNLLTAHNELYSTLLNNVYSFSDDNLVESHRHSGIYNSDRPWCDLAKKADNCVACWNEAWQNIINDFDKSNKLDSKTLEAVYLLRNAHRSGFFNTSSDESNTPSSSDESTKLCPPLPNGDMHKNGNHPHSNANINMKPVYISRSMSESLSSDERTSSVEFTNGRGTPMSSGRSTPSFRKKPKRPDIKISDHQTYQDFVEIRRTDSLTSIDSEMDRYSFISDNSYIDIPYFSETADDCNGEGLSNIHEIHELEETLRDDTPIPLNSVDVRYNNVKKICRERPDSPTSKLLLPVFMSNTNDPMTALHERLSPLLNKLKSLEEQSKLIPMLRSKVLLLQEEKDKLTSSLSELQSINACCHKGTLTDINAGSSCDKETLCTSISEKLKCDKETITNIKNNVHTEYSSGETQTSIECSNSFIQVDSLNSPELFHDVGIQSVPEIRHSGVQKYLEFITEISHKGTGTEPIQVRSIATGDNVADLLVFNESTQCSVEHHEFSCQNDILLSNVDKACETLKVSLAEKSIGDGIADLQFTSTGTQECPVHVNSFTQCESKLSNDFESMCGSPTSHLVDKSVGDKVADIIFSDQNTQTKITENHSKSTQMGVELCDKSISFGCSVNDMRSSSVQHVPCTNDFMCGENVAEVLTSHKASSNIPSLKDSSVSTDHIELKDSSVSCNIVNETKSKGVGEDRIDNIICEKCLVPKSSVAVGMYVNCKFCTIDDKLCDCVKPVTSTVGVGDSHIDKINCDKCENLKLVSVSVGDDKIDDLLCDSCDHKRDANNMISIGVGDLDVNDTSCEKCNSKDVTDNVFNFDLNILNKPQSTQQHAVLCHYCGNKVDLNDTQLDENLQAMRDNMKSISCGMKRSTASKNLNVDFETTDARPSVSDDDMAVVSDDDFEEENSSCRNDVIEACQMLHEHFSGQKPLKQPVMMKYVGIIQALWFKAVKRRRSNASVVKSYLDLFQQRIPELLEMIVNLSDDEGNTALHYALTYKNSGVVSILLDSGECCVDLANQAGYSPIMLAALAGFENKNDKYIMQRLFRLGDVNKESAENGQTPLMLAVSRGNIGIIELLLDAGCDINATDDEGSTALMCSCEHGNINIVKILLGHPDCDATIEDNEGSTALSIAMDARRKDLALLVYGSLNFDARGRIKLSPSKQSLLGLGRRSPSPVIGRR